MKSIWYFLNFVVYYRPHTTFKSARKIHLISTHQEKKVIKCQLWADITISINFDFDLVKHPSISNGQVRKELPDIWTTLFSVVYGKMPNKSQSVRLRGEMGKLPNWLEWIWNRFFNSCHFRNPALRSDNGNSTTNPVVALWQKGVSTKRRLMSKFQFCRCFLGGNFENFLPMGKISTFQNYFIFAKSFDWRRCQLKNHASFRFFNVVLNK